MTAFPRTVTPVSVTELDLPGPLITKAQSGKVNVRGIGAVGRTWKETYLLNVRDTTHKAFLATVRQLYRSGTPFDIGHVDYPTPKGTVGGSPLINLASQLVTNPETFSSWSTSGTPVLTSGQSDPYGGTGAYLISDDDGAAAEWIFQNVGFTGNAVKALAIFLKAGTATTTLVKLRDNTAGADRSAFTVTWASGVPSISLVTGTQLYVDPWFPWLVPGWYRFAYQSTSVTAANTNRIEIYPAGSTAANTGTCYVFGANAWNASIPMPYRSSTGTPVLTGPYLPIDGATGSVSNWLRGGDLVSVPVGSRVSVHEATADTASQADGAVLLPINPPIMTGGEPSDNAIVTTTAVLMQAMILEPPQMPESSGRGYDYGELQISFSEVL